MDIIFNANKGATVLFQYRDSNAENGDLRLVREQAKTYFVPFLAALSALFSFMVLAGFFLVTILFLSIPFAMLFPSFGLCLLGRSYTSRSFTSSAASG